MSPPSGLLRQTSATDARRQHGGLTHVQATVNGSLARCGGGQLGQVSELSCLDLIGLSGEPPFPAAACDANHAPYESSAECVSAYRTGFKRFRDLLSGAGALSYFSDICKISFLFAQHVRTTDVLALLPDLTWPYLTFPWLGPNSLQTPHCHCSYILRTVPPPRQKS